MHNEKAKPIVTGKRSSDLVRDTLNLIRAATRNPKILDAAGALACYARSLEGLIAWQDHAEAVAAMERELTHERDDPVQP